MSNTQGPTGVPSRLDLMARYGITEVPTPVFRYGDYRYTNLQDAIDAAERDRARGIVRKSA